MKWSQILLAAVLGCLLSLGAAHLIGGKESDGAKRETAFERIQRTGTIRCGYYVFPPMTVRDPNTNQLSGFAVDLMNDFASRVGLKVEWTEEFTFASWVSGMQARRFDMACTPMWPDATMRKVVAFSKPMFYAGISPLVRVDDARFRNDLARLNAPDVTFLTQDGNSTDQLTRVLFPKAKIYALAANADGAQYYQSILAKKADAVLTDRNALHSYTQTNGNVVRLVAPDKPVKLQTFALAVNREEMPFKDFIDGVIDDMILDGAMDRLLRKWEAEPGKTFMRVSTPADTSGQ